jgi:predicted amidophosphoribosyltransferase
MLCSRCQHDSPPRAKFCEECAAPLTRTCANCGTQTATRSRARERQKNRAYSLWSSSRLEASWSKRHSGTASLLA